MTVTHDCLLVFATDVLVIDRVTSLRVNPAHVKSATLRQPSKSLYKHPSVTDGVDDTFIAFIWGMIVLAHSVGWGGLCRHGTVPLATRVSKKKHINTRVDDTPQPEKHIHERGEDVRPFAVRGYLKQVLLGGAI
jgi:hypothetical protein